MSKHIDKSLFMVSSMPRFYQQILSGIANYEALGKRILNQIKAAHAFRQTEQIKELARILINIPIKEYQLIAQYYLVWCKCREYQYPTLTLERIIEQTQTYKTQVLFSRAAIEGFHGDIATAIYFYTEALKTSPNVSEYVDLVRSIAVLKATEGFHKSALRDLENLVPLIKHAEPRLYFDFLNSYAFELNEAGRMDEAENVSRITIASPFAPYYPEWQATYSEIRSKRKRPRYVQAKAERQLSSQQTALEIYEPDIEPDTNLLPFRKRQPTHSLPSLYSHVEATGNQYTTRQKRSLIVDIVCNLNEVALDRLFALAMELDEPQARRPRQIDLEEKGSLEVMMGLWTSGDLDPNDHVAVLSALRDCDNNLRRQNIINEMITYIFRFTQERMQGEAMWRKRVEAQLTPESD